MRASRVFLGMGLALSTLVPGVARAGQCILMYSSSANWEDPQNWGGACDGMTPDQRRVPNFDDDVLIGGSEFLAILSTDVSVKSLTVAGGGLSIAPGGHLTVSNGGAVTGSGLGVDGGLFDINGTFVLSMSSYALGVSKNGVVNVNSGATLDFSLGRTDEAPPIAYLQTGGILHNYGTITSDDAGGGVVTSGLINDGVVTASLGRLQVFGAPNDAMTAAAGGQGPFAPGAGGTVCLCGPRVLPPAGVNGAGKIEIGLGFSNWSIGNVIVPPGTNFTPQELDVTAGTFELDTDVTVPVVRLAAGFRTGSATLTASSQLWLGLPQYTAGIQGPGTTVVGPNATGRFATASGGSGGASFDQGHTFINNGTLLWDQNDGPGTISLNQATLINNGTMEIDNDSQALLETTYGGLIGCCGGVLKNQGTIIRDKSPGIAQLIVPTEDPAIIEVKTGTLEIGQWKPQGAGGEEIIESGAKLQNDYTTFGDATVTKSGGELRGHRGSSGPGLFKPSLVIQNPSYGVNSPFGAIVTASLHVLGNFTIGNGGFLEVNADPSSDGAGPLWVDGNSSLGGIVDVVLPPTLVLHDGDHIPLIHETGSGTISGTFSGFVACDMIGCGTLPHPPTFSAVYSATDVYLVVTLPPLGSPVPTVANLTVLELGKISGTIATFTDSNGQSMNAADFTATIDWGDGTTTPGVVSGSGTTLSVAPDATSHAYADEGSYTLTVTVTNVHTAATGHGQGTVTVGDADALTIVSGPQFTAQANVAATNVITATFNDAIAQAASDFTATVDWGDGTSSAGLVTGGGAASLIVKGTHTYGAGGTFTVATTLAEDITGGRSATVSGPVTVTAAGGGTGGHGGSSGGGCGATPFAGPLPWLAPAAWILARRRKRA
ncbi:MAG TPA: hypothetical protein VMH40_07140 [Myxococcaceae bacterium]|nr:hypothetical protein [Myxococcaceae bacterium]